MVIAIFTPSLTPYSIIDIRIGEEDHSHEGELVPLTI